MAPPAATAALISWLIFVFVAGAASEDDAALTFSTTECGLTEPIYDHKFDFSKIHSDLAHQVSSSKDDVFTFNICGRLSRPCDGQENVTACLHRGDKQYVLGRQHILHYNNGEMSFEYTGGSRCPYGDGPFRLNIRVGCDYTLDTNQTTITPYADNACSFYMLYETPEACLPAPAHVQSNKCSVQDLKSGHTYDLMPLSDINYFTVDKQNAIFTINICKPVLYGSHAMCPPGSSICLHTLKTKDYKKRFKSYGDVQANPVIENGQLLMRHTSATPCGANRNITSIIYFVCDKNIKGGHPVFLSGSDCTYKFNFFTALACKEDLPCATVSYGKQILDLSSLSRSDAYKLSRGNKTYTFAICQTAGEPCLENAGSCFAVGGQSTSLGVANMNLQIQPDGAPYLLYENGSPCAADPQVRWTTRIEFVCANNFTKDNNSLFQPQIIEDSKCQLLIQYRTSLACRDQIACKAQVQVEHSEDGTGIDIIDLTPLINAEHNYEAEISSDIKEAHKLPKTTKFFLNVCRPLVPKYHLGCAGGSAACMAKIGPTGYPEEEHSMGYPNAEIVAFNRTAAELRYFRGDVCPTDNRTELTAGIEFHCDMRAGRGMPVLSEISDCHHQFIWRTGVICPPHTCTFDKQTCEIVQDDLSLKYSLRNAVYASTGRVKLSIKEKSVSLDLCSGEHKAVTDYTQDLVNIYFIHQDVDGICNHSDINVQMRLICSNVTLQEVYLNEEDQCNLVYVQRTPDICSFLGLAVPTTAPAAAASSSTAATITSSTTTARSSVETSTAAVAATTTAATAAGGANSAGQAQPPKGNDNVGSLGTILMAILSLTFFVVCLGSLAFSPARRNRVWRLLKRGTTAVRYSRVLSNEEANLLVDPNGEFTDSDDDMLL